MPLARLHQAFDHPDWIFELKYDGFRVLAYVEHDACRLVSRNGNTFKTFPGLCKRLAAALRGREAILDGEIVCLDGEGRPQFERLLYRRQEPCFAGFDLLWADGRDLRQLPLVERKRQLRALVPQPSTCLLYASDVDAAGVDFFRAVCNWDLEGIIAKWKHGPYGTEPTSWVKIKNPTYSQAEGRSEKFEPKPKRRSARADQSR